MKKLLAAILVALLLAGCGGEVDLDDPESRKKILAEAIDRVDLVLGAKDLWYAQWNQETAYTGWVKERDDSQVFLRGLAQYKDGKLDGLATTWYRNGQKASETIHKSGKPYTTNVWKPNGETCHETTVVNGTGRGVSYHDNGLKELAITFKNGNWDGLLTKWYSNGQKSREDTYKDDTLWSAVAWKINGEKCPVTNVVNGTGVWVLYNDDGTEHGRFTYEDGEMLDIEYSD